jgi:hypothetical protein
LEFVSSVSCLFSWSLTPAAPVRRSDYVSNLENDADRPE